MTQKTMTGVQENEMIPELRRRHINLSPKNFITPFSMDLTIGIMFNWRSPDWLTGDVDTDYYR